jgi:hypothetical protein
VTILFPPVKQEIAKICVICGENAAGGRGEAAVSDQPLQYFSFLIRERRENECSAYANVEDQDRTALFIFSYSGLAQRVRASRRRARYARFHLALAACRIAT